MDKQSKAKSIFAGVTADLFARALEQSPLATFITDADGLTLWHNKAYSDLALRIDQARAKLREVHHAADQRDEANEIQNRDAPGEA